MSAQDGCLAYQPGRAMRFWLALGFRYGAHAQRPENDEAKWMIHRTVTHWDWRDRLRILLAGRTEIELCVETQQPADIIRTAAAAVVLAPRCTGSR